MNILLNFEISGKLEEIDRKPIDFMKIALKIMRFDAGLNVDSILPSLDGKFTFAYGASITSWRFAMMQLNGVDLYRITLRVPTLSNSVIKIEELNYYPRVEELIRETMGSEKGLILFSGPTGSGKTTILYATLIERVTTRNETFITLEHPVENDFEELQQCNITENFPYQDAIRSALRANPTGLLIGEIRDTETARAAIDAALTGHATYSTLHLGSYRMLISRLEGLGIQLDELASVLAGVFIQRKASKLCDNCKIYNPETGYFEANTKAEIKNKKVNQETGLEEEVVLPCPKCSKSKNRGYHSIVPYNQVAIFKDNITTVNDEAIETFINFKECLEFHLKVGNIDKLEHDKCIKKVGEELDINTNTESLDVIMDRYVNQYKERVSIKKKEKEESSGS
jgi:type II secretory ATPase GspE/PulE/Tfp pilus assembly ATPase PilB-like protein